MFPRRPRVFRASRARARGTFGPSDDFQSLTRLLARASERLVRRSREHARAVAVVVVGVLARARRRARGRAGGAFNRIESRGNARRGRRHSTPPPRARTAAKETGETARAGAGGGRERGETVGRLGRMAGRVRAEAGRASD